MKITKEGRLPDRTLVGHCRNCGCEFECEPEEVGVSNTKEIPTCPCPTKGCGHPTLLENKVVRKKILRDNYDVK